MTVRQMIRAEIDRLRREELASLGDPLIPRPRDGRVRNRKESIMAAPKAKSTTEAPAAENQLAEALLAAVREKVEGVERVNPKSGSYFRLMVGKVTLGYVNPSKKGLILDLATPADKVPSGVEVKPGPTGSLPIKYRVEDAKGVKTAVRLIELAVPAKEAVPA